MLVFNRSTQNTTESNLTILVDVVDYKLTLTYIW